MKLYHETIEALDEAWGASTPSLNLFARAFAAVEADEEFVDSDGEIVKAFDNALLSTPSLDPFDSPWKPCVVWLGGRGGMREIGALR